MWPGLRREPILREPVGFNQAKTSVERAQYYDKLTGFQRYRQAHKLELAHAAYYSEWFMPAIRELVAAGSFREDPEWIADQLIPPITPVQADLVTTLQGPGPFTVFAPTDEAFDKLAAIPTGDALKDVLLYHVVDGAVGSGDLAAGDVPTLLDGQSVTVNLTGGVKINDSSVTVANIIAKNGVIHVLDTVLIPE